MSKKTFEVGGVSWEPRITLGTVLRYDRRSGNSLMRDVYSLASAKNELLAGESHDIARRVMNHLFPTLESMCVLVYASVEDQAMKLENPIEYEKFVDMIDGEVLGEVVKVVGGCLLDFFLRAIGGQKAVDVAMAELEKLGIGNMYTDSAQSQDVNRGDTHSES